MICRTVPFRFFPRWWWFARSVGRRGRFVI